MNRVAIFVDAGYLFAQGSVLIAGKKLRRGNTRLDEAKLMGLLEQLATKASSLPLLRIYWYDGTDSGPSPAHVSLATQANVKVRLGIVNTFGQQKGVDSLIVTDLINLSRNRAMSDALLVTGDEDIRVGVQQAQEFGIRVHLLGLEPAVSNQSNLLRQEADTLSELSKADVQTFLTELTAPTTPGVASPIGAGSLPGAAQAFASSLTKPDMARALHPSGRVPPDIDGQLLKSGATVVARSLTPKEKRELRDAFIKACKAIP